MNVNEEVIESFRGDRFGFLFSGPVVYMLILGFSLKRELRGVLRGKYLLTGLRSGYLFAGCFVSSALVKTGAFEKMNLFFLFILIVLVVESSLYKLFANKMLRRSEFHFSKKALIIILSFSVTTITSTLILTDYVYRDKIINIRPQSFR
jgi:hypothetical protein